MVIRKVYLTEKQLERMGMQDSDMMSRKQCAEKVADQICKFKYFPLYEENNMSHPIAYCFPQEKVIIPNGHNDLKKRILNEWEHLMLKDGADSDKSILEYLPASIEQTTNLHSYLNQLIEPDGTVKEPGFGFLSSVDYLLFKEGSRLMQYKMLFRDPKKRGQYLIPVWSYSLSNGKGTLEGWKSLYQRYGLVPYAKEILDWLHKSSELIKFTEQEYKELKEYCRKVDFLRLGNKYYDLSGRIFDNGQCWDVFEKAQPDIKKLCCVFPDNEWINASAPSESIVEGGLVSIDFGTKSTVMVISEQTAGSFHTLKFCRGCSGETFLYPTLLKFCDLEKFLEVYGSEDGRPETSWETVSIDDSAHVSGSSTSASGIFRSLKQWMIDPNAGGAVLRQQNNPSSPIELNEYGSDRNSIDPIELYAYYLGLHVNNNQDNKIYLKFRLSFSAICSEQIQWKMKESFRKGIMKSLPVSIINSDAMNNFSVDCTCSEPAAYAVCALACMGMPNQSQNNFFYGIFDFGGGTCDFNYGILCSEQDENLHKNKYKIKIIGNGGDPFLGGENLLELLVVQVFIENRDWFKEHGYKISRPRCYEGRYEDFFSSSFEAANNLECLAEQLRAPIWEKADNGNEESETFEIIVSGLLPETNGGKSSDESCPKSLALSKEKLNIVLVKRIYEGVSAFFNTFYQVWEEHGQKEVLQQLCVFLAGNSCRSKWVRMSFEKYIKEELNPKYIGKVQLCDPIGSFEFKRHIPNDLWDEEQKEKMCERISELGDLDGKTGVAYGLALCGNQVEIENYCVKNYLMYYIGIRNFFDIEVLKGMHGDRLTIGESIPFAVSSLANLYYTKTIPTDGKLHGVKAITLNEQNVPLKENMTCFIRADSQTQISIFVVSGNDPQNHDPEDELIFDLLTGHFKNNRLQHERIGK